MNFNREKYLEQLRTNRLIGVILGLGAIAMAIIIYILSTALNR